MPDAKVIAAVTVNKKMPENDEVVNVEDSAQILKISHSEGLKTVETTLFNLEQGWTYCSFVVFLMKQQNTECLTKDSRSLCVQ
ncbi:hypothetical protein TNCV_3281121 [Trichonephila clavipes]|nr:hypothetical protein TNCV_3281121 [Trichonephila clavipes]